MNRGSASYSSEVPGATPNPLELNAIVKRPQIDFELEFYGNILKNNPAYAEILEQLGQIYTLKNRHNEALEVDLRHAQLRPNNPVVFYNLGCSHALLGHQQEAVQILRKAIDLGYDDADHMAADPDLESLYDLPEFIQLLADISEDSSSTRLV